MKEKSDMLETRFAVRRQAEQQKRAMLQTVEKMKKKGQGSRKLQDARSKMVHHRRSCIQRRRQRRQGLHCSSMRFEDVLVHKNSQRW